MSATNSPKPEDIHVKSRRSSKVSHLRTRMFLVMIKQIDSLSIDDWIKCLIVAAVLVCKLLYGRICQQYSMEQDRSSMS